MRDPNLSRSRNPVNGTDERFDDPYEPGTDYRSLVPVQQQLFNPDTRQVVFRDGGYERPVELDLVRQTVWMTQKELAQFFDVSVKTVSRHIVNILKEGIHRADSVVQLCWITASDGKSYQTDLYSLDILIEIAYRVRRTPRAIRFRQFVVEAVRLALFELQEQSRRRAMLRRAQDVTAYIIDGKPRQWAETRVDTKETFKSMMGQISRVCSARSAYGMVVSAEYVSLLGKTADELKTILGSKNVRDNLPELTLTYLKTAEVSITHLLVNYRRLSAAELKRAAEGIFVPLGDVLRSLCETMNLDRVTGAPLYRLDDGKGDAK